MILTVTMAPEIFYSEKSISNRLNDLSQMSLERVRSRISNRRNAERENTQYAPE